MKTVIVDMMGGDNAPLETVKGVAQAIDELGEDIKYILVGDREMILQIAGENGISLDGCDIVNTEEVITMEDDPIETPPSIHHLDAEDAAPTSNSMHALASHSAEATMSAHLSAGSGPSASHGSLRHDMLAAPPASGTAANVIDVPTASG